MVVAKLASRRAIGLVLTLSLLIVSMVAPGASAAKICANDQPLQMDPGILCVSYDGIEVGYLEVPSDPELEDFARAGLVTIIVAGVPETVPGAGRETACEAYELANIDCVETGLVEDVPQASLGETGICGVFQKVTVWIIDDPAYDQTGVLATPIHQSIYAGPATCD